MGAGVGAGGSVACQTQGMGNKKKREYISTREGKSRTAAREKGLLVFNTWYITTVSVSKDRLGGNMTTQKGPYISRYCQLGSRDFGRRLEGTSVKGTSVKGDGRMQKY